MDGKQLKNSILQWAIQGKLVPQNPKDEPAQKLLERIALSRHSELSEESSKRSKKASKDQASRIYRENGVWYEQVDNVAPKDISDEIPFEIPENWAWCRLEKIVSINGGFAFKSGNYVEQGKGVRVLRISDFNEKGFINTKKVYHPYDESLADYRLNKNDIVMCMTGGTVGKTMYVTDLPEPMLVNQRVADITIIGDIESKYVYQVMRSNVVQDIVLNSKNSTNDNISMELIKNFLIPLPPLAEQKRIDAKLEQVLPLAEEYGAAQEQLDKLNKELPEALKKSILQEAIQGKLVPQNPKDEPASKLLEKIAISRHSDRSEESSKHSKKASKNQSSRIYCENDVWYEQVGSASPKDISDEIPFEIPGTWTWCRMGDIIEFVNGRAYKKEELLSKGKYKVLRVGNFFTNQSWYFSDLELREDKYCYNGDLLYAWSASFGPQIWKGDKTIFHYHIWNLKYDTQNLYREYLYYFFLYDKNQIGASTTGSTMIHVSMEHMIPRLIPIPPLAEQKRIVKKIEELYKVIDSWK